MLYRVTNHLDHIQPLPLPDLRQPLIDIRLGEILGPLTHLYNPRALGRLLEYGESRGVEHHQFRR